MTEGEKPKYLTFDMWFANFKYKREWWRWKREKIKGEWEERELERGKIFAGIDHKGDGVRSENRESSNKCEGRDKWG